LADTTKTNKELIAIMANDNSLSPLRALVAKVELGDRGLDVGRLNGDAWDIVKLPDSSLEQVKRALRDAKVCAQHEPKDGPILNTLGVAQYRGGDYEDAINQLAQAAALQPTEVTNPIFESMAKYKLEKHDEAKEILERARSLQKDIGKPDVETSAFFKEAEDLIEVNPAAKSPTDAKE
jgi:tetratricopeptide (TPR) repeat protein